MEAIRWRKINKKQSS